jgi:hypothetical protein
LRGATTLPIVFLVGVREDPGQAQALVSTEGRLSVLLGRVFTNSLTMRADANLRVSAAGAWFLRSSTYHYAQFDLVWRRFNTVGTKESMHHAQEVGDALRDTVFGSRG